MFGHSGPPADGRWCCECYPYTTLVGAPELGYELERPRYKRKPPDPNRADRPTQTGRTGGMSVR